MLIKIHFLWNLVAGKLFQPTPSFPALQFLDSIEKGSNADKAGLKQNDYVLEVNKTRFFHWKTQCFLFDKDQRYQCYFNASWRMCKFNKTSRWYISFKSHNRESNSNRSFSLSTHWITFSSTTSRFSIITISTKR